MNLAGLSLLLMAAVIVSVKGDETSILDMIPIVAQIKMVAQVVMGDTKGASITNQHFLNEGLITSQARSVYHLVTGNPTEAYEIQKKFVSNLEPVLDGTPVLGHTKGVIHLLAGDNKHGWDAIKSATSTTGTVIGGVMGGPLGAVMGHTLTDTAVTSVESVIGNKVKPHGIVDYLMNFKNKSSGEHFDALAGLVLDTNVPRATNAAKNKFNVKPLVESTSIEMRPLMREPSQVRSVDLEIKNLQESSKVSKNRRRQFVSSERSLVEVDDDKQPIASTSIETRPLMREPTPVKSKDLEIKNLPEGPKVSSKKQQKYVSSEINKRKRSSDEVINQGKMDNFIDFCCSHNNKLFKLDVNAVNDFFNHGGLQQYQHISHLNKLNLKVLTNKLSYLNEDCKSLITKDDFKTINPEVSVNDHYCFGCSLAAILDMDVKTLKSHFLDCSYDCLMEMKTNGFIDFSGENVVMTDVFELNQYLKKNEKILENRNSRTLLVTHGREGRASHAYKLKFKIVNDRPEFLLIDYHHPGLILEDLPNPYRFVTFINKIDYYGFSVFPIEKKISNENFLKNYEV